MACSFACRSRRRRCRHETPIRPFHSSVRRSFGSGARVAPAKAALVLWSGRNSGDGDSVRERASAAESRQRDLAEDQDGAVRGFRTRSGLHSSRCRRSGARSEDQGSREDNVRRTGESEMDSGDPRQSDGGLATAGRGRDPPSCRKPGGRQPLQLQNLHRSNTSPTRRRCSRRRWPTPAVNREDGWPGSETASGNIDVFCWSSFP